MSRTYTLSPTSMHCGYRSSWDGYWDGLIGADAVGYRVGNYQNNYRMVNVQFDSATLATLRSKTVTAIKLHITFDTSTYVYDSTRTWFPIGYKLNNTETTGSSGYAWTRSDADSTARSSSVVVGYVRSTGAAYTAAAGDTLTVNLTGTKVPVYGYVFGTISDNTSSNGKTYKVRSVSLEVTTNETLTLAYNANGGSGAPSSSSKNGTPNATFTVSSTTPTRTGYNFAGWNTKADGTGTNYAAGSSITLSVTGTTTLYAKWTAKTYTITYNVNGGSGSVSSQTKTYGVTLTLRTYSGTKAGYNFLGWAESATATAAAYSSGGSFTKNADTTLYAVWSANSYAVTYYGNAAGVTNVPAQQTKTHGVNLTLSSSKPSRTGYTFSKWNTNSGGTGTNYSPGATYTGNANLSLYAQWTANTYTISYNANGGDGAPSSQQKTYGVDLTLSATVPTRSYYTFLGWSTSNTATEATYSAGGTFTTNANTTLYAVWRKNRVSIRYNANGASMAETHGANYSIDNEGYVVRSGSRDFQYIDFDASGDPFNWNNATVINLAYAGHGVELHKEWNTAADGSGTYFDQTVDYPASDYSSALASGDATCVLYCDWRELYSVTYDTDGGSPAPDAQTKMEGVDLVLSDIVPEKAGYTFDEWEDGSSNTYAPGDTYSTDADLALTAQWTATSLPKYDCSRYVESLGIFLLHNVYVVQNGVPVLQDIYVK